MLRTRPAVLLLATALTSAVALSLRADLSQTIEPGSHVDGPDYSDISDLEGQVVVVEFWGRNCGPCIANIGHVSDLAQAHHDEGLRILAFQVQGGADEQIAALWQQHAPSA